MTSCLLSMSGRGRQEFANRSHCTHVVVAANAASPKPISPGLDLFELLRILRFVGTKGHRTTPSSQIDEAFVRWKTRSCLAVVLCERLIYVSSAAGRSVGRPCVHDKDLGHGQSLAREQSPHNRGTGTSDLTATDSICRSDSGETSQTLRPIFPACSSTWRSAMRPWKPETVDLTDSSLLAWSRRGFIVAVFARRGSQSPRIGSSFSPRPLRRKQVIGRALFVGPS